MTSEINKRTGRRILGVFIDSICWDKTLINLMKWALNRQSKYVCQCNVDVLVTTTKVKYYRQIINSADLANPDGMPIVWALRKNGFKNQERISGPDLMLKICRLSEERNVPVFLYGSTSQTLDKLTSNLRLQFKNLKIVGTYSPPFHDLTVKETKEIIKLISDSDARIVFVGLGCPKQEIWMYQNRRQIKAVMIGVGAAFDIHAGTFKRAPIWMQNFGLEWFFRLIKEHKRLWRRYFFGNIIFILKIVLEIFNYDLRQKHLTSGKIQ